MAPTTITIITMAEQGRELALWSSLGLALAAHGVHLFFRARWSKRMSAGALIAPLLTLLGMAAMVGLPHSGRAIAVTTIALVAAIAVHAVRARSQLGDERDEVYGLLCCFLMLALAAGGQRGMDSMRMPGASIDLPLTVCLALFALVVALPLAYQRPARTRQAIAVERSATVAMTTAMAMMTAAMLAL